MRLSQTLLDKFDISQDLAPYFNGQSLQLCLTQLSKTNPEMMARLGWWCLTHLTCDKDEKQEVLQMMNCVDSTSCYSCYDIDSCEQMIDSSKCKNSSFVYNSQNIIDGKYVSDSSKCEDIQHIYQSKMCKHSSHIVGSVSCNNSHNIINSYYIESSSDILNSKGLNQCGQLQYCTNCDNTYFSRDCENVAHSFFCKGIKDADYMIFNKPYSPTFFDAFLESYKSFEPQLAYVDSWPQDTIVMNPHSILTTINPLVYCAPLTSDFWDWLDTLPNYSKEILYQITFLPRFIL